MKSELLLLACSRFKGERSLAGAFHLLQGKRSAQTIQDAAFFQLLPLFGILPNMDYTEATNLAKELEQKQLVENRNGVHQLTKDGIVFLQQWESKHLYIKDLDCWAYAKTAALFWQRFTLFVQTLSHLNAKQRFIPISADSSIQRYVKRVLPRTAVEREKTSRVLFEECYQLLKQQPKINADLFVKQLSRSNRVGDTKEQLAQKLDMEPVELYLRHLSVLHFMIRSTKSHQGNVSVLSRLMEMENVGFNGTLSAQKTAALLSHTSSIKNLSAMRKLKPATIEDHLVELALFNPDFQINAYVSEDKQKAIQQISKNGQTLKLKKIREMLNEQASYFEIRLVLARKGYESNVRR